jgi:two-component system nitrate/nitrite response regulator NarL
MSPDFEARRQARRRGCANSEIVLVRYVRWACDESVGSGVPSRLLSFDEASGRCSNRGRPTKGRPPRGNCGRSQIVAAAQPVHRLRSPSVVGVSLAANCLAAAGLCRRRRRIHAASRVTTHVFLIGAVRIYREALSAALASTSSVTVVGEAATVDDALPLLRRLAHDAVVLLGAPLPAESDVSLAAAEPQAKVVAVGVPEDEAVRWIEAGVSGFVPPEASLDDAIAALASVAKGQMAASPQVSADLASRVRALAAASREPTPLEQLTARQAEVLELIVEGLSNKQIAQRLSIQEQTVKNHVHHILVKLDVRTRTEAVARARGWRLRPTRG